MMQHPDAELLAATALGEEPDAAVADHLTSCPRCRGEVAELARVADAVRADAPLVAPPPQVWEAVRGAIAPSTPPVGAAAPATVLTTAGVPSPSERLVPRRSLLGWVAAAALAGAAAGAAATWLLTRPAVTPPPGATPRTEATVDLTTLDTREVRGEASVRDTAQGVALAVRTEPLDPGDGYLEVWLINRDLSRMVSVGVLPPGVGEQDFPISRRVLDEGYVVVDISREAFDDRPQHSGDSLVRGELPL